MQVSRIRLQFSNSMVTPKIENGDCKSVKSVYFVRMKATLTELRRDTSRVVRPVIHSGEKLTLTEHGEPCAEIIPVRKIDRKRALADLIAIGPVDFLPRK